MELLLVVFVLVFSSAGLLAYQIASQKLLGEVHLPPEIKGYESQQVRALDLKELLSIPALFVERLIRKGNIPIEHLKRKLISAGRPINVPQFFAIKFLLMAALPAAVFIIFRIKSTLLFLPLAIGFILPDLWLSGRIKKRQALVLRDLPHIIDLLNICVGAGLDFMVAVNKVIEEFRACILLEEMKVLVHEIKMGSSRRQALKNLAGRINSPEVISFSRTLIQADRMGTPISEALKMQAEEIRTRRFQKGEEAALKAPIKLLFPLLFFILPVVLIIVAGPILIQFTRGGLIKF